MPCRTHFFHGLSWNVLDCCCKAGSVVRSGCCATVETMHQKAGRGLTSWSPLHINWKGMKCQACFHHSKTVRTLPPPSSSCSSSSSSHQLVTPQTCSPTSPTRLPLPTTSHSHDQIIFQPPEICLARQKSAAQS